MHDGNHQPAFRLVLANEKFLILCLIQEIRKEMSVQKISLKNVTLMGIDCVDFSRLQKVADISMRGIDFADVRLLSSIKSNDSRWVEIAPIRSIEAYSEFCIRNLADHVDTDYVLLIQYDGFVLNPHSWSDDFLKYDYIGAPFHINGEFWFKKYLVPRELEGRNFVGNGGFSLRSRKFLQTSARLAAQGKFSKFHPEDLVLCVFDQHLLLNEGIRFAPYVLAKKFSVEGRTHVYKSQFGFHNFKCTDISDWISKNPQYEIRQEPISKHKHKRRGLIPLLKKLKRMILRNPGNDSDK